MKRIKDGVARHEMMVIRTRLAAAQLVSSRPLGAMNRAQLDKVSTILIDAAISVAHLEEEAVAPRTRRLVLAADNGMLTAEGRAIVDKRAAERARRRSRSAAKAVSE